MATTKKQRLLVMNGQRILQAEEAGTWKNQRVDKAGTLKPGIYNLYLAQPADKAQRHDGVIVHVDENSVYQQIGTKFVMHVRSAFDVVPMVGGAKSIRYAETGKAHVASEAPKLERSRSRQF